MKTHTLNVDHRRLLTSRMIQGDLLDQLREAGLPIAYSVAEGILSESEAEIYRRIQSALAKLGATNFRELRGPDEEWAFRWETK